MASNIRVHELATELGVTSKEILAKLKEHGEYVKSASSTVAAPVARRLRASFETKGRAPAHPITEMRTSGLRPDSWLVPQPAARPAPFPGRAGKTRVHELAKELGVTSKNVLARLKDQGEFVPPAFALVEARVAQRLRASFATHPPLTPAVGQESYSPQGSDPKKPSPRPAHRPRPAPKQLDSDSARPLGPLVTAAEAHQIMGIRPERIRKWVSRGYLQKKGDRGRAALYDRDDLRDALRETQRRTIRPATSPVLKVTPQYHSRLITTVEVARLFDVSPSTVRSWVARGHLVPAGRRGRTWLFPVLNVINAARVRQVAQDEKRDAEYLF